MTAPPINLAELRAMAEDGAKYEVATDRVYPSMASTDLLALLDAVEAARELRRMQAVRVVVSPGMERWLVGQGYIANLDRALARFQP
jgi:hypothetical protein